MRYLLLATFFISNITLANEQVIKAFSKTKYGKETSRKINQKIKKLPKELRVLGAIGITQEVKLKVNQYQKIKINYKKQSVSYSIQYSF